MNNPSVFAGHTPPAHVPPSKRALMVHWAQWAVTQQRIFSYTQDHRRSEMFHRTPGDTSGGLIHADCSQFYAAIGHWVGITSLTDQDYTGTLLEKGTPVAKPRPADCVVFGGGTGEHAAMITYAGYTIGFGHSPGAPNRVKLATMVEWFADHGHPGVRYLSFLP
jgi:hypothetical protein